MEYDINDIEVAIDVQAPSNDYRTADDRARAVIQLGHEEHTLRSLRAYNWDFGENIFKRVLNIHFSSVDF
jgi:hypothetical protein